MLKNAHALEDYLCKHGYTVFLCDNMSAGDNYRDAISFNAATCKAMVAFLNEPWCVSKECSYEFNIAMRKKFVKGRPELIPLILEDFGVYEKYPTIDGILCSVNGIWAKDQLNEDIWNKVADALKTHSILPGAPASSSSSPPAPSSSSASPAPLPDVSDAILAAVPHLNIKEEEVFVFCKDLWRFSSSDLSGDSEQVNPGEFDFTDLCAACILGDKVYYASTDGYIYQLDKTNAEYNAISGESDDWSSSTVMVAFDNRLFLFDSASTLSAVNPSTGEYVSFADSWDGVIDATVINKELWAVCKSGAIYAIAPDGKYRTVKDSGWERASAMVACGKYVYVFHDQIWRIDPVTGDEAMIGKDGEAWGKVRDASTFGDQSILAITTSGDLWQINPKDGQYILLSSNWSAKFIAMLP